MSGNWDDSGSDDENVVIVDTKPVIRPRSRQPSLAKSLEKVTILENPIAGSTKNEDSDDDDDNSMSVSSADDFVDTAGKVIILDFDTDTSMKKMISQFPCDYRNIITEFADVEIFLISLDSLIVECCAHNYHNWTLAGQSAVLNAQIDRFLSQFTNLGGKFKLVVFSDLNLQFGRDTTLAFVRASTLAHLRSGPYAHEIEVFSSPIDPRWGKYLQDLTPSFFMISTDNVTSDVCAQEDVNLTPQLETVVLDVLARSISVVPLFQVIVNFSTVQAFFIEPRLVEQINWEPFLAAHWEANGELLKQSVNPTVDISVCNNVADLWALVIKEANNSGHPTSEHFESLCCATLVSALVCQKRGIERSYLDEKQEGKRGLDVIRDRRLLLTTAASFFEKVDWSSAKFPASDLWDGRMVLGLFDAIVANEPVLPYRVQEDFGRAHGEAGLKKAIPTDTNDKLFDALPEPEQPLKKIPFLYNVKSSLVSDFIPEMADVTSEKVLEHNFDIAEVFKSEYAWKFRQIEEDFAMASEKIEDKWQQKRANKARQFLSRWYEMFANSLEGRGSNLLVDFSRTRGYAAVEEEDKDKKKSDKPWAGQKKGGGGKPGASGGKKGKEPAKSKKDLILEANKNAKANKIIEGEKTKIKFATQQGKNSIVYLEMLQNGLELPETRALCLYETTIRVAREMLTRMSGSEFKEQRRVEAVKLVGLVKQCLVKYWEYLEEKQRSEIVDIWVSLGFEAPEGRKASLDARTKKLDLNMNMVYYQLKYGGELIDIQSDPQKDDRVTGFAPDGWQRKMLDVVDRGNSAVIIAPTSAGKTFVSYYCIEKVLRASDEDVVVYVSPSKALTNQVCGSVYARFRNKSMGRGCALFGTLTSDYGMNALNCQVLVTVPERLETIFLSTNPVVQQFVAKIKYVIFDEVHSIGASDEAHIWEHLLLLIRCPFLALSATIGNANKLHEWLDNVEKYKSGDKRKVVLINYGERYSELELSIQRIEEPLPVTANDSQDVEVDLKSEIVKKDGQDVLMPFMPYAVYMPEKLRMFGIPDDQQLTARQILELYHTMADVDEETKKEFEPCTYFGYKSGHNVWLSRSNIRDMESKLKKRFLDWLSNDEDKMQLVLNKLGQDVQTQLDRRAVPFNKTKVASENIVPLVDELRDKSMLPAICFNDDRYVCELLATTLATELEERQKKFENSTEFKTKYAIKDEEKMMKIAKRKRDAADKKKKGDKEEDGPVDEVDELDPFAAQRQKLKDALARFKLCGRLGQDNDVYEKMVERMTRASKGRESSKLLLRLFERGIGYHHAGLTMVEKGAVEVLFRSGHLAIIFSTSTLALGMNMPCKTVIFGEDTPMLTPLLFRQMSGRAGRRGFDQSGTVVFLSIPTSKIRRLLTASLSTLQGNPPFTTSFLLRLLTFVHHPTEANPDYKGLPLMDVNDRKHVAMALLRHSFSLFTRREAIDGTLQKQLRLYTAFSVQFLRHLQLIDENCAATGMSEIACNLQEKEPGNLIFVYLLQNKVFHKMCAEYSGEQLKKKFLVVFANLFTRLRLPPSFQPEDKGSYPSDKGCAVFLEPLPKNVRAEVDRYTCKATELYEQFMKGVGKEGRLVGSQFSLSGLTENVSLCHEELVSPVFDGYCHDSFFPIINFDEKDHRGRKVYMNAYAVDFWQFESRRLLESANRLHPSQMWFLIQGFSSILNKIASSLEVVARPADPVTEVVKVLAAEYDSKFRSAFGMKYKF